MLLKPKKTKYKKHHLYKKPKLNKVKTHLVYSNYALVSRESALLNAAQLHSMIMTVKRVLKRKGKLWFRVFPHIPVTKKPLEVRMGKGKGAVDHWITKIYNGSVLIELECDSSLLARSSLMSVSKKLPFKTSFITQ